MKNSTSVSSYICALLISLPLLFISAATAVPSTLLVQTCNKTDDDALCLSSLSSDPRAAAAGDVKTLALIEIDAITAKTNVTLEIVGKLFANVTDPYLYRCYGLCIDTFKGILENRIPQGIAALNSKNYAEAKEQVGDVQSDVELCLEQLADKEPFTGGAQLMSRLAGVAIGIINLLH
ncbi:unnamed protein product [Linum trigynum]|uniref:Pectinesterase inhibitor domain-containing protein n=1 Tax=Linum trigynum TaxID=586398 RepID=A0AAV2GRR4_9ROSI